MIEINLTRTPDLAFRPVTDDDRKLVEKYKLGQPVKARIVKRSERSNKMNRLYWGGLLELAIQYWEPAGGLVCDQEVNIIRQFAHWLDKQSNSTAVINAATHYIQQLEQYRASCITNVNTSAENLKKQLHKEIKIKTGYYDIVMTPSGIHKQEKSISFDSMDQDEFNVFYKGAFSFVWNLCLGMVFEKPDEAQNAINQLMAMG